jgi:5-(carboxyamino)imidazole ribonucleotide synthase
MLALAGYPLGLRFRFLDPTPDACAGQVAELMVGSYEVPGLLEKFATGLDLVTYEFENVPVTAARFLAEKLPVYPPPVALEVSQDRLTEKEFFQRLGIPTAPFAPVHTHAELEQALHRIGLPAVLKTRRLGYDGKGQAVMHTPGDVETAWNRLKGVPLILEGFIPFERECSVLAARSRNGQVAFYPLVENRHHHGILERSLAPIGELALQAQAEDYARRVLEALDYVGIVAIEFFQHQGHLCANEMAPRVHNSGHWTIEGAVTSQFSQHLRAVLGLPLGSTATTGHVAMLNLIGALPERERILAVPGAHLHLYGKAPRPGRKVGHVTLWAADPATRAARLAQLEPLIENVY